MTTAVSLFIPVVVFNPSDLYKIDMPQELLENRYRQISHNPAFKTFISFYIFS